MANKIKNDFGVFVYAAGAENSLARIKQKYPKLIQSLVPRFYEMPVTSIISQDLIDIGFEEWEAKLIVEAVEERTPA